MRSILLWDIPMRGSCAQTHTVQGSKKSLTLSHKGLSHIFGSMPEPTGPQAIKSNSTTSLEPKVSLNNDYQPTSRLVQRHNWVFEVLFPQFQSRFISSQNVVLALWVIKNLTTISCRLRPPECPRFLTCLWLLNSRCLTLFLKVIVQSPRRCLQFLCRLLGKGVPVSVNQRRSACPPQYDSH